MKLDINTYFFNAKMDYLPYYKKFSIDIDEDKTLAELLALIQEQNFNFVYPESNLYLRVNSLVINGNKTIQEVVNKLGTSIQIDPISNYRATNRLIINDDDFMQSFKLLADYANEEDLAYYKKLYSLHYASETFTYNNQYIGDAILILAHKMISDGSEYKQEILSAISEHYDGLWECEYDNNLFDAEDHSNAISELKEMADGAPSKYKPLFVRKYKPHEISNIEGIGVAFYAGSSEMSQGIIESTLEQIQSKGAVAIRYDRMCKLAGQTLVSSNPKTAYLKMGMMLLDAMDNGADILVVHNEEDTELFRQSIGLCEKVIQRDIKLDIISRGKLMGMSSKVA